MWKNFSKKYLYKNFFVWTGTKKIFEKKNIYIFIVKLIMTGIWNENLLNFIKEKTKNDIKKKFVVVFP